MALVIPKVLGPLNELMTSVRVQGAVPGAKIVVAARGSNPRDLAQGTAAGGDDVIPLLSGVKLTAGDLVGTVQTKGGDSSPPVPDQLMVQVAPGPASASDLGYIGSLSHLYVCGRAVWLTGAVPGATAEVRWSGTVHGQAVAGPDGARVVLDQGLPSSGVTVRQVAPVGAGPDAAVGLDRIPAGPNGKLPAPTVNAPLVECQTAVLVTGVYDGADVTITHKDGHTESAFFDLPGLWFRMPALRQPDTLSARQTFERCKLRSDDSKPPVPVGPASAVPKPVIADQLCRDAVSVRVANLVPGALVKLTVPGPITYSGMAPPDTDYYDFFVVPLATGPTDHLVKAVQTVCGVSSPESDPVTVKDTPAVTTGVKLIGPLMECGRAVHVSDAHPGGLLRVWARSAGADAPISGFVVAGSSDVTIPVAPYLRRNDLIRVVQYGCSTQGIDSNAETVQAHATPAPPNVVDPVYATKSQVSVKDAVPGALVEVYVATNPDGPFVFAGSTIASSMSPTVVSLTTTLALHQLVRAVQTLCGTVTEPGHTATVVPPPPQVPTITNPKNGATGVAKRPTFGWKDPGVGGPGAATSFELQILNGTTTVVAPTGLSATSFTPGVDLPFAKQLTLQVRAKNTSGTSAWGQAVFTTEAPPAPVAPTLLAYNVSTKTLTGQGFLPSTTVWVRLSMIGSSVQNVYGQWISDTRDQTATFTSDAAGKLSAVVDPVNQLPILVLDDDGRYLYGVAPGEVMHFSAHDSRTNPADLTGVLWSNTLNVTA